MRLTEFPDLQWIKAQANQSFANRRRWDGKTLPGEGWPSVILNAKATHTHRDNIKGPLSIFTNLKGDSSVSAGGKHLHIKEGFFGISNHHEEYTLHIDNPDQTETLNVHFGETFLQKGLSSLRSGVLDGGESKEISMLFNRVAPLDSTATSILKSLTHLTEEESMREEELLFNLLTWLFKEDQDIKKSFSKLEVSKSSTQKEISDRLLLATDYIYAYYNQPLTLEELASAACLSKFHFLRLFKTTFGITPYQFINKVRVQHAKKMLSTSNLPVTEIAAHCGFINASTFSRMFYQQAGIYPTQFRV